MAELPPNATVKDEERAETAAPAQTTGEEKRADTAAPAQTTGEEVKAETAAPAQTTGEEKRAETAAPAQTTGEEVIAETAAPAEITEVDVQAETAAPAEITEVDVQAEESESSDEGNQNLQEEIPGRYQRLTASYLSQHNRLLPPPSNRSPHAESILIPEVDQTVDRGSALFRSEQDRLLRRACFTQNWIDQTDFNNCYHDSAPWIHHQQNPVVMPNQQNPVVMPNQQHPVVMPNQQHPVVMPNQQHPVVMQYHQRPVVMQYHQRPMGAQYQQHPMRMTNQQHPMLMAYQLDPTLMQYQNIVSRPMMQQEQFGPNPVPSRTPMRQRMNNQHQQFNQQQRFGFPIDMTHQASATVAAGSPRPELNPQQMQQDQLHTQQPTQSQGFNAGPSSE